MNKGNYQANKNQKNKFVKIVSIIMVLVGLFTAGRIGSKYIPKQNTDTSTTDTTDLDDNIENDELELVNDFNIDDEEAVNKRVNDILLILPNLSKQDIKNAIYMVNGKEQQIVFYGNNPFKVIQAIYNVLYEVANSIGIHAIISNYNIHEGVKSAVIEIEKLQLEYENGIISYDEFFASIKSIYDELKNSNNSNKLIHDILISRQICVEASMPNNIEDKATKDKIYEMLKNCKGDLNRWSDINGQGILDKSSNKIKQDAANITPGPNPDASKEEQKYVDADEEKANNSNTKNNNGIKEESNTMMVDQGGKPVDFHKNEESKENNKEGTTSVYVEEELTNEEILISCEEVQAGGIEVKFVDGSESKTKTPSKIK